MEGGDNLRARRRSNSIDAKQRRQSKGINWGSLNLFKILLFCCGLVLLTCTLPRNPVSRIVLSGVHSGLNTLDLLEKKHAVVIDAGSTGSRVLAFSFHTSIVTGELVLDDELWHQVKPGLSSFADEPLKGGETIEQLINIAKGRIPEKYWTSTPISLKATAGLRLLPAEKADTLLETVRTVLDNSGFVKLSGDPGVEIMSDLNEGIYGWVTINYLLGHISNPGASAVALDLGGGSTQITFLPSAASTLQESPDDFLHNHEDSKIYTHSYLGLGLMSARREILQAADGGGPESVSSPCFTKDISWSHQNTDFNVKPENPGFETCRTLVDSVIHAKSIHSPAELEQRSIVAFSYFFDRAVEAGLVGEEGGVIAIHQYRQAAEAACGSTEISFECIDLTFIYSLLNKYGLDDSSTVGIYKKINGHETSWALGCALNLLNQ